MTEFRKPSSRFDCDAHTIAFEPKQGEYVYMSNEKNKGGRPPAHPGLRRVHVSLRLPQWIVQWIAEQPKTTAELVEAALLKTHKLRRSKPPHDLVKRGKP